jgi:outer membrane biosynthesis protein TonB
VSRTELINGSGDSALDQKVLAALREVSALRPPDAAVRFPQRTVVRGATGF